MFQFITYADDTTITSTLNIFKDQGGRIQKNKINNELNKINNWLKANKLSLNLLINLKDQIFEPAVGSLPNLARMCP